LDVAEVQPLRAYSRPLKDLNVNAPLSDRTSAAAADPVKPAIPRQTWMTVPIVISVSPPASQPNEPLPSTAPVRGQLGPVLKLPALQASSSGGSGETELSRRLSAFRARLEPLRAAIMASIDTDGVADPPAARRRADPAPQPRAAAAPRQSTLVCLQQAARKLSRVAPDPGPRDSFKFR
jgi:hypothetical protein